MTTGRINQVRTIGGARARRAPPAGPRPPGCGPKRALARPAPRRSAPQAGLGAELPIRGGPLGRSLASPRPAPSSPGQTASPPPSGSHVRSARRLHASSRGAPLGTVRLRTATRTKACDPSATASALPLGRPPPLKDTSRLHGGHRSPHAPGPSRRDGAPAPGYGHPTAGRRPGLGSVGVRSWRPGRRQRPCHRALCVLTRRGCPILYVPAQCAPAKTEALLPSRFREGRRDLLPSQNGRGGERPPQARRSVGRAGRRAAPGVATERGTLADGRRGGMHRNR